MTGRHEQSTVDTCEWAALHSLGALTHSERAAYEQHIAAGCAVCSAELQSFEKVASDLNLVASSVQPPPSLRERLLDRVSAGDASEKAEDPAAVPSPKGILFDEGGVLISRSAEMTWEPAPLPGIFSKLLFNDPKRCYTTQIVRMDAGATYPSHRHSQVEELYLLEGDLFVEGQKMGPGDYCRGEPDSVHGEVSTEAGALFLVLSSPQDEILA